MKPVHNERWAIVGGGFLGMTLALRLAQQGKSVTLYEAAPTLGGLASSWQLGNIVWDRHYHVILSSDTCLLSLLSELGLDDQLHWEKAGTGFYIDSQLHSLSNFWEFLRFPPLNLADKLRLALTILRASRTHDWKALERIPVQAWLERWSGSNVFERVWLPLLRAKLGENYRETSAAFIWATISRMYAARKNGSKTEFFGYVPGGYARIIHTFSKLLRRTGVDLKLGLVTQSIYPTGSGELQVALTNGESQSYDSVAVTMPSPIAARLCPSLKDRERELLNGIKYQGVICASLLLKRPLAGFYITNIADDRIPFTAVIEMSALVDRKNFDGQTLVYLPKYATSDSEIFRLTDQQLREKFLAGLELMYPNFDRHDLICFQVSRVKYLLPIPTLGYSVALPPVNASITGLYLLNSTHIINGTLNINETVQLAESAARELAAQKDEHRRKDNVFTQDNRQLIAGSRQPMVLP